ncbi:MAG: CemA family [Phormidesmis priestleyi Ana]|uniref:Proton extrusion protein PxcA n=1 Tax=Phormidesmis priestleyi Ana TaxID=1666911 RepID=A0A0P7YU35_9CYAN|nr:MAG: CemA family [Phormidesmis priestleyi Ana]
MTNSSQRLNLFSQLRQWFTKTPDRALDQAYEAALKIRQLEDNHFDGNPVSNRSGNYSRSSYQLLQKDLKKYLSIINRRMAEFRASNSVYAISSVGNGALVSPANAPLSEDLPLDQINGPAVFFTKLKLIDTITDRYQKPSVLALNSLQTRSSNPSALADVESARRTLSDTDQSPNEALSSSSSVLPRSILRTVDRIKQDLDPDAETEVVRNFRNSKTQTTVAITFVLQLIIIPLLAQYLSKNFIVSPIVERSRDLTQADVFLNREMEEDALHELQQYEERFRFEVLIGKTPAIGEADIEERVREKAFEIEEDYRQRSADAVENVFADVIAVLTFSLILTSFKEKVATLKAFIDEIIYGLSDSAKAFIIILFTDIFVGFHSPHGWEVLLEGLSNHLGLPASRNFIFLFIATFPVILDTVFKYWIFRYLNRISPSAVATYKNMNE